MASTITDIGTDNSEHMEMIASEVKAGKDPIVNFNQDSKVIVKHMESPDTQNNSTKVFIIKKVMQLQYMTQLLEKSKIAS